MNEAGAPQFTGVPSSGLHKGPEHILSLQEGMGKGGLDSGSSVVQLPERQLQGFLVFQSFSFEFLRFARR